MTLEPLSVKEIFLCEACVSLMGKKLKDNQYEIISIEGITFEDDRIYKNENEIKSLLNKYIQPKTIFAFCQKTKDSEKIETSFPLSYIDLLLTLNGPENKTLDPEVNEFVSEPEENKENSIFDFDKYMQVVDLFGKKLDLTSLGGKYGYLTCMTFLTGINEFSNVSDQPSALRYLKTNQILSRFTIYDSYEKKDIAISVQEIDKLLALPVIHQTLSSSEMDLYMKLAEHMEQETDLELGIVHIKMENEHFVSTKNNFLEYLRKNVKPSNVILNNGTELSVDEYLKLLKQNRKSEKDVSEPEENKENSISEMDKYMQVVDLFGKKLDLTSLGGKYGYLTSMTFKNPEIVTILSKMKSLENACDQASALQHLKTNQIPSSFTIYDSYKKKDIVVLAQGVDKLLALPVITQTVSSSESVDEYLEQNEKDVSEPEENKENSISDFDKYMQVADLFDKKLDLSSFGRKYGYLKSIVFLVGYAPSKYIAHAQLKKFQIPSSFTIYDSDNEKDIAISVQEIDKLLALPVINQTLTSSEMDLFMKLSEHMEQETDLKLGINCIKMEDGFNIPFKYLFLAYLRKNIRPKKIKLNNEMELNVDEYLRMLSLSMIYQETNFANSSVIKTYHDNMDLSADKNLKLR